MGGHRGFSLILPCECVGVGGVRVHRVVALFFMAYLGFRVCFFAGPGVGAERQYLRLLPLTVDSPQTMATTNVMAMNKKVRSMLFWGIVVMLLIVCKRQLMHTPLCIGLWNMERVLPQRHGKR